MASRCTVVGATGFFIRIMVEAIFFKELSLSSMLTISSASFIISLITALMLGVSKAGLKGLGTLIVTLLALAQGARASVGILVPLLIFADCMAVSYYRRDVQWHLILKFLPWMLLGISLGTWFGKDLPELLFKRSMAIIILISVLVMIVNDRVDKKKVPTHILFAGSMGVMAGFTTMVGNLAGSFTNVYFLAMRVSKTEFIGTAAFLFFIANLIKFPLHVFIWETITWETLTLDLYLVPAVVIGFYFGLKIVGLFNEKQFRKFIIVMTTIAALLMFIS